MSLAKQRPPFRERLAAVHVILISASESNGLCLREAQFSRYAFVLPVLTLPAQPVCSSDEPSMCFFSLLGIAHHHERVLAKNGAQFRRMMDNEWYAQTSKQACHPGEIFNFTADEYSIVLLFKMPL